MALGPLAFAFRALRFITALAAFVPSLVQADARTLGPVTYTVPDGWAVQATPGSVTRHVHVDQARGTYAMLIVYEPAASAGSLDADFTADWRQFTQQIGAPVPVASDAPPRAGWAVRSGRAAYTFDGKTGELIVVTYATPQRRVSVGAMTTAPGEYRKQIDAFLASVQLAKATPAPAPVAPATAPAAKGARASDHDGWQAVEESAWVHVTSLRTGLVARVHAGGPADGAAAWQQLIVPRYPGLANVVARTAAPQDRARTFITAQGNDAAGRPLHVALYGRPGWPWIELVTPDRASLHTGLTTVYDGPGTSWSTFDQLERFSKQAARANELVGTWQLGGAGTLVLRADGSYNYKQLSKSDPLWPAARDFGGTDLEGTYYMVGDWALYFRSQRVGWPYPWGTRLLRGASGIDLWLFYAGSYIGPFTRAR